MNLFGLVVRSPFALQRKDTAVPDNPRWWHRVTEPFAGAWQRNVECDATGQVLAFSAAYACVTRIANDIAKMPLLLVERDANGIWKEVERESPFWTALRKPNAYQNRIQFIVCWLLSKLIAGNTYVLQERDGRGVVRAWHILDPMKVRVMISDRGDVFYRLKADPLKGIFGEVEVNVPASEVIHDLMNPFFHPLCGVSPLYAAGLSATQGNRIQQNSATFFENQSTPSGLLVAPGEVSDEMAAAYTQRWQEKFSGRNRSKVAFLGNGLKYERLAFSADDSQLIDQLNWTAVDVARAFGMPLYKIGAGPVPTSNNVEALDLQYLSDVLHPYIEAIELGVDEGLGLGPGTNNPALGTMFDLDVLVRMDSKSQIEMLSAGIGAAIYSPNEARKRRNLTPVDGGGSPMIQQQNYSLAALARRDSSADPFGTAPAPAPAPAPAEDDDAEDDGAEERAALEVIEKGLQWAA